MVGSTQCFFSTVITTPVSLIAPMHHVSSLVWHVTYFERVLEVFVTTSVDYVTTSVDYVFSSILPSVKAQNQELYCLPQSIIGDSSRR